MVKMISIAEGHRYDGRVLSKDEKFDAEERFVPILEGLGRARRAEVRQEYATREMRAAPPARQRARTRGR
jgi:hypothetical protein